MPMRVNFRIDYPARLARARADALAGLKFSPLDLGPNGRLEAIGPKALEAFEATWRGRRVTWPWPPYVAVMRRQQPDCFNLAVWHGDILCGLAIGKVKPRKYVGLNLVEANPDRSHPLKGKIVPIVLTVAEFYRIQLAATELRLYECDPNLLPYYEKFGFELAPELGGAHDMRRRS